MPQGPPARTVGARLREAREKRGVSLRQIANTTRISVMSLEALERSDLSRLPGGIFTRAFIRAYAQEVGLDPDRTIQDFVAELPSESVAATAHPASVEDGEKLESDRKAVATAIRLMLVSVPIVGLGIYYSTHRVPAPPAGTTVPSVEAPATVPNSMEPSVVGPSSGQASGASGIAQQAAMQVSGLAMEIAPRGACWVSVTVDGEPTFSGLMSAGDKRAITAREEILLTVGDAAAFAYTLNGSPGSPLGAPGEVVSKRITLANLNEFVTP
jgi:cytoskeleton protein RodZ